MPLSEVIRQRSSFPKVGDRAPSRDELLRLIEAAASIADHGSMRPWRLIELRGDARDRLGAAFVEASGLQGKEAIKLAFKPLRAPLLIAIVGSYQPNFKVATWEQEAVATGVGHMLSLLLDNAGWGVIWRTGGLTRSEAVHRLHELAPNEVLLGWLYVGSKPPRAKPERKKRFDAARALTAL